MFEREGDEMAAGNGLYPERDKSVSSIFWVLLILHLLISIVSHLFVRTRWGASSSLTLGRRLGHDSSARDTPT